MKLLESLLVRPSMYIVPWGPGLLESAYEVCLNFELDEANLKIETQKPVPVTYRGRKLDCGYRIDMLVEDTVIVEIKSVDSLNAVHGMQLLSYLRLSNLQVGLLINFNVPVLKQGIQRIVNHFQESQRTPQRTLRTLR